MKKYIYLLLLLCSSGLINFVNMKPALADIYMRVGKNGTVYFSNVPVSNNYRLYMKTRQRSNNFKRYNNVLYRKIILKASNKYKVSSRLIEAVIKAESGFNDEAVSDKGAEGLMQLMPGTQRQLNVMKPFNPSQNIYGGTEYLKSLIVRYNGNLPLALAAYNAGSKAVKKYGGIPPYSETRDYVNEVMKYYRREGNNAK
ncbi:MAG: lytic transglycosylase domain-containing protein [Deltaproteobacteria bacterium]|nr:lytic transglycosylase domain-containing protein [Deltaproteobacteria bacterium]